MTSHDNIGEINVIIQDGLRGTGLDGTATRERLSQVAARAIAEGSPSLQCYKAIAQTAIALEVDELQGIDSLATALLARWSRES